MAAIFARNGDRLARATMFETLLAFFGCSITVIARSKATKQSRVPGAEWIASLRSQ
jgi:hypothetical protein